MLPQPAQFLPDNSIDLLVQSLARSRNDFVKVHARPLTANGAGGAGGAAGLANVGAGFTFMPERT